MAGLSMNVMHRNSGSLVEKAVCERTWSEIDWVLEPALGALLWSLPIVMEFPVTEKTLPPSLFATTRVAMQSPMKCAMLLADRLAASVMSYFRCWFLPKQPVKNLIGWCNPMSKVLAGIHCRVWQLHCNNGRNFPQSSLNEGDARVNYGRVGGGTRVTCSDPIGT